MSKIFIITILTFTILSCKTFKSLHEIKKENASVYSYDFDNKEIKYIPMHHLGKKEFYCYTAIYLIF